MKSRRIAKVELAVEARERAVRKERFRRAEAECLALTRQDVEFLIDRFCSTPEHLIDDFVKEITDGQHMALHRYLEKFLKEIDLDRIPPEIYEKAARRQFSVIELRKLYPKRS